MSRMFPLLGSLLGSTPGRRRGGGAQGSFDFTTMNSAQLLAAGWSWTRDNAIYVPDSAGDYAEIAAGVLAKSDLGVHCFGGFTNYALGMTPDAATVPANTPDPYLCTRETWAAAGLKGLPAGLRVRLITTDAMDRNLFLRPFSFSESVGQPVSGSIVVQRNAADVGPPACLRLWRRTSPAYPVWDTELPSDTASRITVTAGDTAADDIWFGLSNTGTAFIAANDLWDLTYSGPQVVLLPIGPNVLALSSAATTETASQIPVLSRVTPGECSFVLPVITSPGRKGTDDVIASASLDANNQLLVIHENADNNILLRLVTSGSTVGEVDLGIVGDNVYTVISGKIEYADGIGRLAGALEGMSEMIEVTGSGIIPPPAFTRWTLGNDHSQAAATQFWGSVAGLRIN